jgi:TRAP-type C4-dicarboxylate transport system substrate-binding protein
MTMTFLIALFLIASSAAAQEYIIKFATLAPEGSTWMNVMHEFDQAVRTESSGMLGFKIYSGGVQGDEIQVLRKIKLGQLHGAGITGVGITSIAPAARIFDSPFLFKSYSEVDYIADKYRNELNQAFEKGGFVHLGWAEVGWTYVFTNTPVSTPADFKHVKMWMWEGDPVAEAMFQAMDIAPIPLSVTDVLTSLQTKMIDGVYSPPLALIAMQWFSRVKYMLNAPLADATGAAVIAKKKFDELPPRLQEILLRNGRIYMAKLTRLSREDNARALETLKQSGITIVDPPSAQAVQTYEEMGARGRKILTGKLYSEDLLRRVESDLAEYRHTNKTR